MWFIVGIAHFSTKTWPSEATRERIIQQGAVRITIYSLLNIPTCTCLALCINVLTKIPQSHIKMLLKNLHYYKNITLLTYGFTTSRWQCLTQLWATPVVHLWLFVCVTVWSVLLVWHRGKAPVCPLESEPANQLLTAAQLSRKESTLFTSRLLYKSLHCRWRLWLSFQFNQGRLIWAWHGPVCNPHCRSSVNNILVFTLKKRLW